MVFFSIMWWRLKSLKKMEPWRQRSFFSVDSGTCSKVNGAKMCPVLIVKEMRAISLWTLPPIVSWMPLKKNFYFLEWNNLLSFISPPSGNRWGSTAEAERERIMNSGGSMSADDEWPRGGSTGPEQRHSHLLLCCHKCIFNESAPLTPLQSRTVP